MALRLERIRSVQERTGLCISEIYRGMREGWFPKNFPISKQSRAWNAEEVDTWIASKIAARNVAEVA
ncbi:helix-turn-helix transcriptional regulator [Bradyrhizobium sp. 27S5]|uniref:helix-turn-helix transcriptional regulator n=1 Tax=Bradyrhizobium sp. 27S5 TaxID=3139728 RepID=UPI0030D36848